MHRNIVFGQYYPGTSIIHKLDPRLKIFIVFLLICSICFTQRVEAYFLMIGFLGFNIYLACIPLRLFFQTIRPLWLIFIMTIIINFLLIPGNIIFNWGIIKISAEGFIQGLLMGTRLLLLIILSSMLTFTTSIVRLTDGIEYLLKPFTRFGFPAHELALMMTVALRFIPTLFKEVDKIMKAQIARGADFKTGNFFIRIKKLIHLIVPLFINIFRRADDLAIAMESRCYRGGKKRTRMIELNLQTIDFLALTTTIILFIFLLALRVDFL